jgi:hypothetical protein
MNADNGQEADMSEQRIGNWSSILVARTDERDDHREALIAALEQQRRDLNRTRNG